MQHHDAITGTCYQNVADDYYYILDNGTKSIHKEVEKILQE